MRRKGKARKRKPGVGRQRGGIAPALVAALPVLAARGKAAAMGGIGAVTNYGTLKVLQALEKYKRKRRRKSKPKPSWQDAWADKVTF